MVEGGEADDEFGVLVKSKSQRLTQDRLKALLSENDFQFLEGPQNGQPAVRPGLNVVDLIAMVTTKAGKRLDRLTER